MTAALGASFEEVTFLYIPTPDTAAEAAYFTSVLPGRLVFAIEADGTRVADIASACTSSRGRRPATHFEGRRDF